MMVFTSEEELSRWLRGKEFACSAKDASLIPGDRCYSHAVIPLGWEAPLEKEMATHSSILA